MNGIIFINTATAYIVDSMHCQQLAHINSCCKTCLKFTSLPVKLSIVPLGLCDYAIAKKTRNLLFSA